MQTVFHHDQWDTIGVIDSPSGLQRLEVWFSYQTEILVTFFFHFNYLIRYLYGKIINPSFYMEPFLRELPMPCTAMQWLTPNNCYEVLMCVFHGPLLLTYPLFCQNKTHTLFSFIPIRLIGLVGNLIPPTHVLKAYCTITFKFWRSFTLDSITQNFRPQKASLTVVTKLIQGRQI